MDKKVSRGRKKERNKITKRRKTNKKTRYREMNVGTKTYHFSQLGFRLVDSWNEDFHLCNWRYTDTNGHTKKYTKSYTLTKKKDIEKSELFSYVALGGANL